MYRDRSRPLSVRRSRLPNLVAIRSPNRIKANLPPRMASIGGPHHRGQTYRDGNKLAKLAPNRRAQRNSSRNRSLSASPLLNGGLLAQRRMRPARHGDRSSPTDTTHVDTKSINSTPLSADNELCQAHFFFTTFCVVTPLAQIARQCSALQICDAIGT